MVLLEPEAAYAAAQKLARAQGDNVSMNQRTLYKRMGERGFIASSDKDRNTKRWTVAGELRAIIHLFRDYLLTENVSNVPNVQAPSETEKLLTN